MLNGHKAVKCQQMYEQTHIQEDEAKAMVVPSLQCPLLLCTIHT